VTSPRPVESQAPANRFPGWCCSYCGEPLQSRPHALHCAAEGRYFATHQGVHRLLPGARRSFGEPRPGCPRRWSSKRSFLDLAGTDVDSHLGYLSSVARFHEALKHYFLPAIFDGRAASAMNWKSTPLHRYRDERTPSGFGALALLAAHSLACWSGRRRSSESDLQHDREGPRRADISSRGYCRSKTRMFGVLAPTGRAVIVKILRSGETVSS